MRPIALLLIVLLSSCAMTREKAVGIYTYCPYFEVCSGLFLESNGTFKYINGLKRSREDGAEGTWTIVKNIIELNSYTDDRNSAVIFEHTKKIGSTINVRAEGLPLPCANVKIYYGSNIKEINTDKDGIAHIDLPKIDSVSVWFVGLHDVHFTPPLNSNCFDVRLNYYDPIVLQNEHWKIRGRKIYVPASVNSPKPYTLKKEGADL